MPKVGVAGGHGLKTAGKRTPDGYGENYFNHPVKEYIIGYLADMYDIDTVDLTPDRDLDSLSDRVNRANSSKCDIAVFIHFNAFGSSWNSAEGVDTFHYPGSAQGLKLAREIQGQLIKGTEQKNRGVKAENFYVLRKTVMPAVLCECGFMTNKREAALMKSDAFRRECAREIAAGIAAYFGISTINYKSKYYTILSKYNNIKKDIVELIKKHGG